MHLASGKAYKVSRREGQATGRYYCLLMRENVELRGAGKIQSKIKLAADQSPRKNFFAIIAGDGHNMKFTEFSLIGNRANQSVIPQPTTEDPQNLPTNKWRRQGIRIQNASNCVLTNFKLTGVGEPNYSGDPYCGREHYGVELVGGAGLATGTAMISGCEFVNVNGSGLGLNGYDIVRFQKWIVSACTSHDNLLMGFAWSGVEYVTADHCTAYNNAGMGFNDEVGAYNVWQYGNTHHHINNAGMRIGGNYASEPLRHSIGVEFSYSTTDNNVSGVKIDSTADGAKILYNTITNNQCGIKTVTGATNVTKTGNTFGPPGSVNNCS